MWNTAVITSTAFLAGSYALLAATNPYTSHQELPAWTICSNALTWIVSIVLVTAIYRWDTRRYRNAAQILFAVVFLYNFGLMMQLSNAHVSAPKVGDLVSLRPDQQWVADSTYAALVSTDYPQYASIPLAEIRNRDLREDTGAKALLFDWETRVNQKLQAQHLEARRQAALKQAYKKAAPDASADKAAYSITYAPSPFDLLPQHLKFEILLVRLIPILFLWLVFALFGSEPGRTFLGTGAGLIFLLSIISLAFTSEPVSLLSPHHLGLFGLTAGAFVATGTTPHTRRRLWHLLFDGPWIRLGTVTIYLSFVAALAGAILLALAVRNASTGIAELLKLPLAFILMWILILMRRKAVVPDNLPGRQRKRLRESPFFYPASFLILLILLVSPVALLLWLDIGQAITFSLAVVLALLFTHHEIRGSALVACLYAAVVFVTYELIIHIDHWEPIVRPVTRPVYWVSTLGLTLLVVIFWLTPFYRRRRLYLPRGKAAPSRRVYSAWSTLSQAVFVAALSTGAILSALATVLHLAASKSTIRYRLALFEDLFDPSLVNLRGGNTESWWDATSNLVTAILGIIDTGAWGYGLGRGGAEHIAKASQDFMFSTIVGDWGLIGGLGILAIFAYVAVAGYRLARSLVSARYRYFACVTISLLITQTLVTVLGNMGVLPLTGITLPLVSAGFSSASTFVILLSLTVLLPGTEVPAPAPSSMNTRIKPSNKAAPLRPVIHTTTPGITQIKT